MLDFIAPRRAASLIGPASTAAQCSPSNRTPAFARSRRSMLAPSERCGASHAKGSGTPPAYHGSDSGGAALPSRSNTSASPQQGAVCSVLSAASTPRSMSASGCLPPAPDPLSCLLSLMAIRPRRSRAFRQTAPFKSCHRSGGASMSAPDSICHAEQPTHKGPSSGP